MNENIIKKAKHAKERRESQKKTQGLLDQVAAGLAIQAEKLSELTKSIKDFDPEIHLPEINVKTAFPPLDIPAPIVNIPETKIPAPKAPIVNLQQTTDDIYARYTYAARADELDGTYIGYLSAKDDWFIQRFPNGDSAISLFAAGHGDFVQAWKNRLKETYKLRSEVVIP